MRIPGKLRANSERYVYLVELLFSGSQIASQKVWSHYTKQLIYRMLKFDMQLYDIKQMFTKSSEAGV